MTDTPRECSRATGQSKVRYASRAEARRAARFLGPDLGAYRCPHCQWFHIGHQSPDPTIDRLNRVRVFIEIDGRMQEVLGQIGELEPGPCRDCGLKVTMVSEEVDGMLEARWVCPDGHVYAGLALPS